MPDLLTTARAAQRAAPIGPLAQARAAAEIGADETVRLRDHLVARLEPEPSGDWVLRSRAGDHPIPAAEEPAIRELLGDGRAEVRVLGVDLARRLLVAGVVVRP